MPPIIDDPCVANTGDMAFAAPVGAGENEVLGRVTERLEAAGFARGATIALPSSTDGAESAEGVAIAVSVGTDSSGSAGDVAAAEFRAGTYWGITKPEDE